MNSELSTPFGLRVIPACPLSLLSSKGLRVPRGTLPNTFAKYSRTYPRNFKPQTINRNRSQKLGSTLGSYRLTLSGTTHRSTWGDSFGLRLRYSLTMNPRTDRTANVLWHSVPFRLSDRNAVGCLFRYCKGTNIFLYERKHKVLIIKQLRKS